MNLKKIKAVKNISAWCVESYTLEDALGNFISYANVPFKEFFKDKMTMINAVQYGYVLKKKKFAFYKPFYDHELKKDRKMYFDLTNANDTTDIKSATIYSGEQVENSRLKNNWYFEEI